MEKNRALRGGQAAKKSDSDYLHFTRNVDKPQQILCALCGFARITKPFTCRRRSEMKIRGVYYFGFIYLAGVYPRA